MSRCSVRRPRGTRRSPTAARITRPGLRAWHGPGPLDAVLAGPDLRAGRESRLGGDRLSLIADEAVFFGGKGVSRGRTAVVADWKRFFDAPTAPFSWAPAEVEVLASGTLGYTSGPVYDPQGGRIGTFNFCVAASGRWIVEGHLR